MVYVLVWTLLFATSVFLISIIQSLFNDIQNEVCIILSCSGENYNFVESGHFFQKIEAARSKFELLLLGNKMDQSFIKIEYKSHSILQFELLMEILQIIGNLGRFLRQLRVWPRTGCTLILPKVRASCRLINLTCLFLIKLTLTTELFLLGGYRSCRLFFWVLIFL